MSKKIFTVLLASLFIFSANSYASGLIGHWGFEEGSGLVAGDSSANANTGALTNGPAWTSGKIGGALSFGASNDYVNIPDSPSLDISGNQMTFAAWIKPQLKTTYDRRQIIAAKTAHSDNTWLVEIYPAESGIGKLNFFTNAGRPAYEEGLDFFSNARLSADTWYHIACVYDGSFKNIYINGILDNSIADSGNLAANDLPMTIGSWGGDSKRVFKGNIDEVYLYNYALSQSEVQALIPEPATMSLLALGGLMIRRKK